MQITRAMARLGAFLLLAALASGALASPDPCVLTPFAMLDAEDAYRCLHTQPFSTDVRDSTVDSVRKAIQLCPFLDIAANPPSHVQPVDVLGELERIGQQTFDYDFEFQMELASLFARLGDAHTRYIQPLCYQALVFVQPISLIGFVSAEDGRHMVTVSTRALPPFITNFYANRGVQLNDLSNATVVSINGVDAVDALRQFADSAVGYSKDLGTKYNLIFESTLPRPTEADGTRPWFKSAFQVRDGQLSPPPSLEEAKTPIKYEFRLTSGELVTRYVPWAGLSVGNLTGTEEFTKYCLASDDRQMVSTPGEGEEPSDGRRPRKFIFLEDHDSRSADNYRPGDQPDMLRDFKEHNPFLRRHWEEFHNGDVEPDVVKNPYLSAEHPNGACDGARSCFQLLHESEHVHAYRISDHDRVVIIQLDTYGPDDGTAMLANLTVALDKAAGLNLDQVVLDLTYNGGGSICLGQKTMELLLKDGKAYGATQLPQSKLAITMAAYGAKEPTRGTPWSPNFYTSSVDGRNFTDDSWMLPGHQRKFGGKSRGWSEMVYLNPDQCYFVDTVPPMRVNISEMIIVTHGLCGSTCALVANHAALYDNVKTVAVGGFAGEPMAYTSFPGLQVLDTPPLWGMIEYNCPNSSVQPGRLTTSANYRMCIRQIYPKLDSPQPTEYTFLPADVHIPYSYEIAMWPEFAWFQVSTLFDGGA